MVPIPERAVGETAEAGVKASILILLLAIKLGQVKQDKIYAYYT
jgi:hypothetical protein